MRRLALAMAGAATLVAAPALAQTMKEPHSFRDLGQAFSAADIDNDGSLSRGEFSLLRANVIDRSMVRAYRGDAYAAMGPAVDRSYARLDANSNGQVSRAEFMSAANDPMMLGVRPTPEVTAGSWAWNPNYMTLTYYLTLNPVDADQFNGRQIVNLAGDEIGRIRNIVRVDDRDRYYVLVDISRRAADPTPTRYQATTVGIPLNDVLLYDSGRALMLSSRGQEYLGELQSPEIRAGNYEDVERIYTT